MQSLYGQEFIEVGHIRKNHGYKGHAKVAIDDEYVEYILPQEFVFLEIDGYKVPFFIEEIKEHGGLIYKFRHLDNSEDLMTYQKAGIFLLKKDLLLKDPEFRKEKSSHQYAGYKIYDEEHGLIGTIERVEEYPQQEMAILLVDQKEILIPLHEDLIVSIDSSSKTIHMDLPEGLV